MTDRYQIDPEILRKVAERAETERLVALKDDSARPCPTVGVPSWENLFFGSGLWQPSGRREFSEKTRSTLLAIGRMVLALGIILGFFQLLNAIFS